MIPPVWRSRAEHLPPATAMFPLISGSFATRAIHAAAALGIADLLRDAPRTADDLAATTGAHGPSLYRLLRALASIGIFRQSAEGRFAQTPLSATLQTGALREMALRLPHPAGQQPWGDLLESVRTGRPSFEEREGRPFFDYLAHSPQEAARFQIGMTGASADHAAQLLANYDFSPFRHVVDVGGGQGALLTDLLAAYPALTGTLFDLPHVAANPIPLTNPQIAARRTVIGGDFFAGVPSGADVYLLKAILHDWNDQRAVLLLRSCRNALRDQEAGRVIVMEMVVPRGNAPHPSKFMDLNLLVLTEGRERTQTEFRALFKAAALRLTRIIRTAGPLCILEGVARPNRR